MDADRLRDLISRGMGNAARVIGDDYDLFRTRGHADPLAPGNRIMRLPVIFDEEVSARRRARGFDRVIPTTCDSISMRVGDYLRGPRGTLFVAALPPMQKCLCVLTNLVVDVLRPGGAASVGLNSYGGVTEDSLELVLSRWPVQATLMSGMGVGLMPADGGRSVWSFLSAVTSVPFRASDLLQDESGRRFLVKSCDASEMGWHLSVVGTEV